MKKQILFFAVLIISVVGILNEKTVAQTKVSAEQNNALQDYIDISSLEMGERRAFFGNLSAENKSNLFRLHLTLQFAQRSNLTKDQKDLILQTLSTLSTEKYSKTNSEATEKMRNEESSLQQKAKLIFSKQEGAEIFASLGGDANVVDMLRKYQDISKFSMADRKAIFVKSTSAEKSNLWKIHLSSYLAKHSELDTKQMNVVLAAIDLATSDFYDTPKESSEWKSKVDVPLKLFSKNAHKVFSTEKGSEIFDNLGGFETENTPKVNRVASASDCGCSRQSDWCWNDCRGVGCTQKPSGCGTLWGYPCDHLQCS
jgi:hypothetical protein